MIDPGLDEENRKEGWDIVIKVAESFGVKKVFRS
jgi:hypothetical protein